jgi:hypothetical protein
MIGRLILVLLVACTPPRKSDAPIPPSDPSRLDHGQHAQVSCISCHRGSSRPGAEDHKPCDDSGCHKKEFSSAPGKVCDVCHAKISTEKGLDAPLKYKDEDIKDPWQSLPPVFSHARHMDASLMEDRVGFHVGCRDCHTRGDVQQVRPNHATCSRCHASEVGLKNAPKMEDCGGCHRGKSRQRVRKRLIIGDLEFDHDAHRRDAKGGSIRCEDCHRLTAKSTSFEDHPPPRVENCVNCHDDTNRVRYEKRMRICETCHRERTASLTVLAPRNHLPATERPIDHTLAFRRDHAEVASRSATRCATCHVQMSGNPKDACDECHQRMLPADHRITWRELDHGPESIASRDRCATCHVVEFCTACHSQRPRSHGFVGAFERRHSQLARLNVRPCVTCHERESFCNIAGCHDGLFARPPRGSRR